MQISEIMSDKLISLSPNDPLSKAKDTMGEYHVRNLPVVDEDGKYLGMLNQKGVLSKAFELVDKYGSYNLAHQEKRATIGDIVDTEVPTVTRNTEVMDAGQHFLNDKHGCLAVVEDEKLIGIVTSTDYVRLCLNLLRNEG